MKFEEGQWIIWKVQEGLSRFEKIQGHNGQKVQNGCRMLRKLKKIQEVQGFKKAFKKRIIKG